MTRTETGAGALQPISKGLLTALRSAVGVVQARPIDRLVSAHDASHFRLIPQAVVTPAGIEEVVSVMEATRKLGVPITFRSGGTSLSGQAGSEGVLVDTRRNFRSIDVLDGGLRVRAGAGATVRAVNTRLQRLGRKLGPDPASEVACTIGGIVANNSSGMTCGTHSNSYRTLESSLLVLPSGTVVDTAQAEADQLLHVVEPEIYKGLERLRDRIRKDPDSVSTIRSLFAIKNTMGYSVNAFLDFDRPVDILEHLVVGSEGTLAFVAQATFRTVPARSHVATGLLIFGDLEEAAAALPALVAAGFAAIELMDATSLRVAKRDPEATSDLLALDVVAHAALLVEYQEETEEALHIRVARAETLFRDIPLVTPGTLSTDSARRTALWGIRKGLYATIAGSRPSGVTSLLEDIAVPTEQLHSACSNLVRLFEKHGYEDAVIFGHAKDGNLHFMLNEQFADLDSVARYAAFTEDLVDVVLVSGGTLKAEHGTGRIMAPFVRRQYGDELYEVMTEVKRLIDPENLLNPGVVIGDDSNAHLTNLKVTPAVEDEVDRCVECGYCEPVCPSRDLTLTPRDRIVVRREIASAEEAGDTRLARALRADYEYDAVQTCAVDGMCQTTCPVRIDTGSLVRRLRAENASVLAQAWWTSAARHWDAASQVGGMALAVGVRLPESLPRLATDLGRAMLGAEAVPSYSSELPSGGTRRRIISRSADAAAVYFASCTNTLFGPADGGDGVAESFLRLCKRAGVQLETPDDLPSLCCGTPWKSKGFTEGYDLMRAKVAASLRRATRDGELPVVCDASSCTEGLTSLLEVAGENGIRVVDAVSFVADHVLAKLPPGSRVPSMTIHPTCSSTRLGIGAALTAVAAATAIEVVIPDDWGCCAFAGDRGLLHPELTASACAPEAGEVVAANSGTHASLNRTCELGMTRATGYPFRHVLEVLDGVIGG